MRERACQNTEENILMFRDVKPREVYALENI